MLQGRSRRPLEALDQDSTLAVDSSLSPSVTLRTIFSRKIERMQPPRASPGDGCIDSWHERIQRHRNLPPCYRFNPSDEQLLRLFLRPFVEGIELTTCPIHTIADVYSSTPEILTSRYEQGTTDREWFFFGVKKDPESTSRADRVIDGGVWVSKGHPKLVCGDGMCVGYKGTRDFYGQGLNLADWRMEEFQLRPKTNHILAKIFPLPCKEKRNPKSGSIQTTSPKEKQNQTLDDHGSLPHQQTETHQSHTADETFIYTPEKEHREWMRDYFPNPSNQQYQDADENPSEVVQDIDSWHDRIQRHRNLPPCYRFNASDEQLLRLFLGPFVEGIELTTCPIHTIADVYSSTPEVLTGQYEQGTADREWFFVGIKKYPGITSKEDRVIDGGAWVKKGYTKKVWGVDGKFLGFKSTQDFYAQGLDHADWRMEEFQLRVEYKSGHILAKIFPVPYNEKKRSKSGSFQSTSPKEKQNQTLESLPHQQTET